MTELPGEALGARWRAALADPTVVHLDAAGAAAPSRAVLEATVAHLRREAAIGGYPAEVEAAPALSALHASLGRLVGLPADGVTLAPNATAAFTALLGAWPLPRGARVATIGSEYESNRLALGAAAARGQLDVVTLATTPGGCLDLDALARALREGLGLVTFPVVASHRGVVQPAAEAVALAHEAGVPVLLDVAQAAGHVALADLGADAYVGTARKWLRGPRGTGWLAATPASAAALAPEYPSLVGADRAGVGRLATGEASIAARVGLAVALDELLAADLATVTGRIAALGARARAQLDGVGGWRVQEPGDTRSGLVTLAHPELDPVPVAARLLAAGIVTAAIPARRAPSDLAGGVLRASLHAFCRADDLDRLEFSLRR